ncbi:phBC6A51 family helix-turn-helix protein [Paenibacillus sp. AK121]|nr:phBC6A51 family helix-turn-helix protein [Paenibacillus sp. AK121]MBU9705908.1 helix-turn-helix domain-containing protein [Paenibacillus sp. AK121]
MAITLTSAQLIAIDWLSQPHRGGKTYEEIAKLCGVTARTLENWRKNPMFDAEFRRKVKRVNDDKLPQLVDSLVDIAIRDGNAAMAKLALQMGGMLTESVEVTTKRPEDINVDELLLQLQALGDDPEAGE